MLLPGLPELPGLFLSVLAHLSLVVNADIGRICLSDHLVQGLDVVLGNLEGEHRGLHFGLVRASRTSQSKFLSNKRQLCQNERMQPVSPTISTIPSHVWVDAKRF